MTNKQYQDMVEEKYNKSLREIMYELCVIKNVVPTEGASILGVPKKTFTYWRTKFEFGPLQIQSAYAEERRKKQIEEYKDQLEVVDLTRPFLIGGEPSFDGFIEVLERYLEVYKAKRTMEIDTVAEMTIMMHIASLEQVLSHVNDYRKGALHDKFAVEAQLTKSILKETALDLL